MLEREVDMFWLSVLFYSKNSLENLEHFGGIIVCSDYIVIKSLSFSNSG